MKRVKRQLHESGPQKQTNATLLAGADLNFDWRWQMMMVMVMDILLTCAPLPAAAAALAADVAAPDAAALCNK